ncbi:helix-turn-helix transcriptional regulator [Deltaproteobacteria bacterium IMCC39524]|nr:helix-turn-helix transcriptional regulator [Deltaproteobacteria bacterium IMCC39524]
MKKIKEEKARYQKQFGARLKIVRKHFGEKQEVFAKRVNASQSTIARLESGERMPEGYIIKMVSEQFGCDIDWLVTGEGESGLN